MARVLVVDDEPIYCQNLEFALQRQGHEVRTTSSSEQAFSIAREFHPDLLIVDWLLKTTHDGVEVSEILGQAHPMLKTILITGYPADELQSHDRPLSVVRILEKPFSLTAITELVREVLQSQD